MRPWWKTNVFAWLIGIFVASILLYALRELLLRYNMQPDPLVAILALATLFVVAYQVFLTLQQLELMRRQDIIIMRQLESRAELRIGLADERPLVSDSPPGNPNRYRLVLCIINDGSKPAEACHVRVLLPVIWHESAANVRSRFSLAQTAQRVSGVDYFGFEADIAAVNAGDAQEVLRTAFTGTPGVVEILWRVSSAEGNFPSDREYAGLEITLV